MTPYCDENLLPISALQHLVFCERQCALIHIERLWVENRLTVEGRHLHDRAHEGPDEHRANMTVARGLPLRSTRVGLFGIADVVELYYSNKPREKNSMPQCHKIVPIEYKRGRPKQDHSDRVQLCAQAMCLEEMFHHDVPTGYLFYGKRKRRTEVDLNASLRQRTLDATHRLHELIASGETPRAHREPKCNNCSLVDLCLPTGTGPSTSTASFFRQQLSVTLASETGPQSDADFDSF